MSIFIPIPNCLDYCSLVRFKIRKCESSTFVPLFPDCLMFSESLEFLYKIEDQLVNFCKRANWDVDNNFGCVESVDQFGDYCSHDNNQASNP